MSTFQVPHEVHHAIMYFLYWILKVFECLSQCKLRAVGISKLALNPTRGIPLACIQSVLNTL